MLKNLGLGFLILSTAVPSAFAEPSYIESFLREFHENPHYVLNRVPDAIEGSRVIKRGYIQYSLEKQNARDVVIGRTEISRYGLHSLLDNPPEDPDSGLDEVDPERPDNVLNLLYRTENQLVRKITDMDRQNWTRATPAVAPWSDSYWPMHKGIIAVRYADEEFPNSKVWLENYNYYLRKPSSEYLTDRVNALSPAEKYDLLIGDPTWTLTQRMWNEGAVRQNQFGEVSLWQGICHGWAAASHFRVPPPQRSVFLRSPAGVGIEFYESDIKALTSFLWANSNPRTRFVGSRCRVSRPARDAIGRIVEPTCLDVDPATWHLAAMNHMAGDGYSFIMDATYDLEVWNYPISGFRALYFNPQNFRPTSDLKKAMVPIREYRLDKFRAYRDPRTAYVVGVQMDVNHPTPLVPHRGHHTSTALKTIRYVYDLELDEQKNIIGGEWYSNAHPDFIWTFDKDAVAVSSGDLNLGGMEEWSGEVIPSHWANAALRDTARGRVLEKIVRRLILASQAPAPEPTPEPSPEPSPEPIPDHP